MGVAKGGYAHLTGRGGRRVSMGGKVRGRHGSKAEARAQVQAINLSKLRAQGRTDVPRAKAWSDEARAAAAEARRARAAGRSRQYQEGQPLGSWRGAESRPERLSSSLRPSEIREGQAAAGKIRDRPVITAEDRARTAEGRPQRDVEPTGPWDAGWAGPRGDRFANVRVSRSGSPGRATQMAQIEQARRREPREKTALPMGKDVRPRLDLWEGIQTR